MFIPAGVTVVRDNKIICFVVNPEDKDKSFKLLQPLEIDVEQFGQIEPIELNLTTKPNKFDISKINTDHMNEEEKYEIQKFWISTSMFLIARENASRSLIRENM